MAEVKKTLSTKEAVEVKKPEVKIPEVKTPEVKAPEGKKEEIKKEEVKKPVKKTVVKKAVTKKIEVKTAVCFQFNEKSFTNEDLVKIAKDVWKFDLKKKPGDLKTIELYVKPEENMVYYIMNELEGNFSI